jgi:hypothetical protein
VRISDITRTFFLKTQIVLFYRNAYFEPNCTDCGIRIQHKTGKIPVGLSGIFSFLLKMQAMGYLKAVL